MGKQLSDLCNITGVCVAKLFGGERCVMAMCGVAEFRVHGAL